MFILVINCGSSSLKFQLFKKKNLKMLYKGHIDGIGLKTCVYHESWGLEKKNQVVKETKILCPNHAESLKIALQKIKKSGNLKHENEISAVGHRVVHGGEKFRKPTLINQNVIETIKDLFTLAPLHNPPNLEGILASQKLLKNIPHIAVFDTAFHQTLPEKAYLYALPMKWYQSFGIRRYGFHGTSHQYVSHQAMLYLKKYKKPFQKIITCHLGNGVSLTAIKDGKSIDTSMGFTPLEGPPMGTRCGNIDAAILPFAQKILKLSPLKIDYILNHESGMKGISGVSSDIRVLRDAWFNKKDLKVKRAFDLYCYQIAKYIGGYAASLSGLDCLVFTAGIGENASYIRAWIVEYLKFLGAKLDPRKNDKNSFEISKRDSRITVLVIPTNEELQIAREVDKILRS